MGKTIETISLIMKDREIQKETANFSEDVKLVGPASTDSIGMYLIYIIKYYIIYNII